MNIIMRKQFLRVTAHLLRLNFCNSFTTYRTCVGRKNSSSFLINLNPRLSNFVCYSTDADQTLTVDDETIKGPSSELMKSLSEDDQKRLQIIWMEVEVFRQSGFEVPRRFTDENWKELLELIGHHQRRKFCRFLTIKEAHKDNEKRRKEERRKLREEQFEEKKKMEEEAKENGHLQYGLRKNTIFHRIHEASMNTVYNSWGCQAILYGQNLVIDMDYDIYMRKMDCQNCAEQIQMAYGVNRINREQFHLHLCNVQPDSLTLKALERSLPNLHESSCLVNVTSKSYLDLFPKEKLVYLTPNCNEVLLEYDHNAVYIIGGLVDKSIKTPVSMAKAKKEGIKMAKLPLDKYLLWGMSGKSLTLDQMMKIMLDIKITGDWNLALQNVPQRKLKRVEDINQEFADRLNRRKQRSLYDDESEPRSNPRRNYVKK